MRTRLAVICLTVLAIGLGTHPASAAGFDFVEQGGKAAGMAGAFVAQADDPTAIFYNIGGLALSESEKVTSLGLTLYTLNESLYQGLPPGIGGGTAAEQGELMTLHPHAYLVLPVSDSLIAGVGLFTPFFFETDWLQPDSFAGRGVATNAELVTYDLNPAISYAVSDVFGIGLGVTYRSSELKLGRRFFADNPGGGDPLDVGDQQIDTDFDDGFGFNFGLLHKPSDGFSWGLSYRSAIEIDYNATGVMTQVSTGDTQLDALFAASLPYDDELAGTSTLEFPESGTVGFAFHFGDSLTIELDGQWTGWSSVDRVSFAFTASPVLDHEIIESFDDTTTIRAGAEYSTSSDTKYRFGVALDESPQSDAYVGPFLVDADRTVITAGFGKDPLDLAFVWIDPAQRIISNQIDDLNGNYRSSSWKLTVTMSF